MIFEEHIISLYGNEGKEWLKTIPVLIETYKVKWNFVLEPQTFRLNYNYVVPVALADGRAGVLKLGFPENKEFFSEIAALQTFNGNSAVALYEWDLDNTVALIERAVPGEALDPLLGEEKATSVAISVMQKLWKPVPKNHSFPHIKDWFAGFARYKRQYEEKGLIPKDLFDRGENIFRELLESSGQEVLLHGDLHYGNLLSSRRAGYLAIDPKGVIGERAYETGALLRNPFPSLLKQSSAKEILQRRIDQFADELGFEKQRIWGWGFAQSVLSAIWALEDGEDSEYSVACADILLEIK